MTDIRARLADALREHSYTGVINVEKAADVLLSMSGIAIMEGIP